MANFNFSSPRIPKIASLLYFWVFVVKEKLKLSQNYLLDLRIRFDFIKFTFLIAFTRMAGGRWLARSARRMGDKVSLFYFLYLSPLLTRKNIFSSSPAHMTKHAGGDNKKILARFAHSVWLYFNNGYMKYLSYLIFHIKLFQNIKSHLFITMTRRAFGTSIIPMRIMHFRFT